ncbi:MAG: arginase family protein [Oxalobacter sp.]|nr:MAG: arginase family protein [Oxalobacter sp.]
MSTLSLITFIARTADRNPRGMLGAATLCDALAEQLDLDPLIIGTPFEPLNGGWKAELDAAMPDLQDLAQACEQILTLHMTPLIVMGRCASALATLPVVARNRPDACVVWFDAHADANTPDNSVSGYLGGMVLTGAAGLWDSGLGGDMSLSDVVLVGVRDIDPAERALIDADLLRAVPPGKNMIDQLRTAIGNRPVYIHIDCDVLEPGIVPTEYRVPGGLTLNDLRACCDVLAQNEIVGIEIAEFEVCWGDAGEIASPESLLEALKPLLRRFENS